MSRQELSARLRDPRLMIVDVLPRASYDEGHVPGALSLPVAEIPARARMVLPDPHAEICLYCASLTCNAAERGASMLRDLGYTRLQHYHGGLADWREAGLPLEHTPVTLVTPPRAASPPLAPRRHTVPVPPAARAWANRLVEYLDTRSTTQLFALWVGMGLTCGVIYWIAGLQPGHGLIANGVPIGMGADALATAIYFSFVSATSVGYGDIVPTGALRVLAVMEAGAGLLAFGAVVSKFVSRKQDALMSEIARITSEDRLDRVQTNLHLVLGELQAVLMLCDEGRVHPPRVAARVESAAMVLVGELRAVHDLLYRPQQVPEEGVLEALLASLAAVLRELVDLRNCLPPGMPWSPTLPGTLRAMRRLADEICGECVPRAYAPALRAWMDRVQEAARRLDAPPPTSARS